MRAVILLIFLFSIGLYSKMAHSIGADRDLNTAIITAKQIVTPANPGAGFQRLYCKSDGKCYTLQSDGTETELGSGGAADFRELMTDPSFEELTDEGVCANCTATLVDAITVTPFNVNRLSLVFSAAGTYTVTKTTGDGFSGLPSNVQCEVSTTATDVDFAHRSNGVNVATVDVPEVSTASGAGATTKVVKALESNVMGTTSEGFQIIAGSASTVFLDNCTINTENKVYSVGIQSDWIDTGPVTVTATTTNPTKAAAMDVDRLLCRRNGPNLDVRIEFVQTTGSTGTAGSGDYLFNIPTECTGGALFDSTKVSFYSDVEGGGGFRSENGTGGLLMGDGSTNGTGQWVVYDGNKVRAFHDQNNGTAVNRGVIGTGGFDVADNGFFLVGDFSVPIANWSAGQDALSSAGGGSNVRLDTANGYGSTATKIRRFTNTRTTIGSNVIYEDSAANGASFTAKTSGFYFITYADNFTSSAYMGLSLNASSLTTDIQSLSEVEVLMPGRQTVNDVFASVTWGGWLWAGDIVRAHTNGIATGSLNKAKFSMVGLLDMFAATLRDVVKSPGSSNGKPILLHNSVSATEVITSPLGDSQFITSCTNAAPAVCTLDLSVILGNPRCWATGPSSAIYIDPADSTSTSVTVRGLSGADIHFDVFCKGFSP